MEAGTITSLAQLGGTVTTVFIFIWYLVHKNSKSERAMKEVTDGLNKLHIAQETHTKVLIQVARNHGNQRDADDLMTS